MSRSLLASGTAVIVVVTTLIAVRLSSGAGHLADRGCPSDAPVMAFNIAAGAEADDIAVLDRDGGVRRVSNDNRSWDPSFSPDGAEIVFTQGKGNFSDGLGFEGSEIFVMDSDGSGQRPLMEEPPATFASAYGGGSSDSDPAWSPDGESIAFVRGDRHLMIVAPSGADPQVLHEKTGITSIAWSPDSSAVAFTNRFGDEGISVVDADDGSVIKRVKDVGADGDLAWSSDGATIAFESYPDIYTIDYQELREPELFVSDAYAPAWSPDGNDLAYLADKNDEPRLFTRESEANEESRVDTGNTDLFSVQNDLEWVHCPAD